jgi:peroxiredoxin
MRMSGVAGRTGVRPKVGVMDGSHKKFGAASLILSSSVIMLLVSNGVLLRKYERLRNQRQEAMRSDPDDRRAMLLVSRPMTDERGRTMTLSEFKTRYVLLFVFTHSDCQSCLSELSSLDRVARARTDIGLCGLAAYSDSEEAKQTQRNYAFTYPVFVDPDGSFLRSLNLPRTPWKFVIEVASGQIVLEDPPSTNDADREAFFVRVMGLEARASD